MSRGKYKEGSKTCGKQKTISDTIKEAVRPRKSGSRKWQKSKNRSPQLMGRHLYENYGEVNNKGYNKELSQDKKNHPGRTYT